jgi:inorganic pyrophosphatase
MHPWHDLSPGKELPHTVQAIIEIPRGSKAKYEIDKQSGFLKLDRVLTTALHYPINYGFIPQTYAGDHDPLDILVFSQIDLPPLTLVNAKIIGVLRMIDKEEMDDKIIAVALTDIAVNHIENLDQFPEFILNEIRRFFEDYKKQGNVNPVVIPQLLGKTEAVTIIEEALNEYQKLFLNGKRI